MAKRIQFRRGTTTQTAVFVGAPGELTVDTDKNVIVVHDGITPGGWPTSRLTGIDGTATFTGQIRSTSALASTSVSTGAMVLTGGLGVGGRITTTQLVETSSITFKENVNPLTNALDMVLQLTGVSYDRKDKSSINEAGLIAEDVNKIIPNVVVKDEKGNPYGIQYTKVIAYLIEAIKDQQTQINELKKKV
jgi:hypothetical protein